MKYDISIIIPAYNCEKTINRCVDSILKNKINLEIIIVNDCSKDNTLEKLKVYEKNSNISIYNLEENRGVAYARNVGITNSKGTYIGFVDSDDYVNDKMFVKLMKFARKNKLDICGCNYYEVYKDKNIKSKYLYENIIIDNEQLMNMLIFDKISPVIFDKIYKREYLLDNMFDADFKVNEDYLFIINHLTLMKKAMFINEYLYFYDRNNSTITKNYTCEVLAKSIVFNGINKQTLTNLQKSPNYNIFLGISDLKVLHLFLRVKDRKNRLKYIKKYVDKKHIKQLLFEKVDFFYKFKSMIFILSPMLYIILADIYWCKKTY